MPVIARFYGIIVKMYLLGGEHNPPHVHILYGEKNGVLDLNTLTFKECDLPAKARALGLEWASAYQQELLTMWKTQSFRVLPPLE